VVSLVSNCAERKACAALGCRQKRIGPSGLRALPLAAGRNVGGHSTWRYILFLSLVLLSGSLLILPEGVVVGFQILAWVPNSQKH
jgi:hypothetical protein